jgi:hypothetical protein
MEWQQTDDFRGKGMETGDLRMKEQIAGYKGRSRCI